MRLNLRQVEAFRAVFQTGSMTAAGELMGVTQPAVSRLIRDLEAEVEIPLFERSGGRVTPTPDAVALFREVERSFHGLDRIARAATELRRRREGELRIAASVAPSFYCLPSVIGEFHAAWPGVGLSLTTCSSPEVLDLAAMQQCDLGVAVVPAEAPGVRIEPLPIQDVVCVLPAGHSLVRKRVVRPGDLQGEPLLVISDYSLLQQRILQRLEAAGVRRNVVFESSFSGPICGMIAEGAGIALLDPLTALAYEGERIAVRRFEPAVPYELKLICSATRPMTERAAAFAGLLERRLGSLGRG
jgi:DNA-binding transcriptional LysR family regulator